MTMRSTAGSTARTQGCRGSSVANHRCSGRQVMNRTRALNSGVVVGLLLAVVSAAAPPSADADFNVGAQLKVITPGASALCGSQGGTSIALVQGSKVAGIDLNQNPV